MQILVMLLAILVPVTPAISKSLFPMWSQKQASKKYRVADGMIPYIGGSKLYGCPPEGYKDLLALWVDDRSPRGFLGRNYRRYLMPDKNGMIPVLGRLVFKGNGSSKYLSYEFNRAALVEKVDRPIQLRFTTEVVGGVSYVFEGYYVGGPLQAETSSNIYLKGVITKLKNGREVDKTTLEFVPFIIKE